MGELALNACSKHGYNNSWEIKYILQTMLYTYTFKKKPTTFKTYTFEISSASSSVF